MNHDKQIELSTAAIEASISLLQGLNNLRPHVIASAESVPPTWVLCSICAGHINHKNEELLMMIQGKHGKPECQRVNKETLELANDLVKYLMEFEERWTKDTDQGINAISYCTATAEELARKYKQFRSTVLAA